MNDVKKFKAMKPHYRDLNFLEPFDQIELDNKITPLICATSLGRVEFVNIILENDTVDINLATESSGVTPVSVACMAGNYEVLSVLLENGADIHKVTKYKQPPLVYCFTRLYESDNLFENQLICMKMAEKLLEFGADIDCRIADQQGCTLLMQFCSIKFQLSSFEKGINLSVIRFLLEHGANRDLKNSQGSTAYDLAQDHCNSEEVRAVLLSVKQKHFRQQQSSLNDLQEQRPKKFKWFSAESYKISSGCCNLFKSNNP